MAVSFPNSEFCRDGRRINCLKRLMIQLQSHWTLCQAFEEIKSPVRCRWHPPRGTSLPNPLLELGNYKSVELFGFHKWAPLHFQGAYDNCSWCSQSDPESKVSQNTFTQNSPSQHSTDQHNEGIEVTSSKIQTCWRKTSRTNAQKKTQTLFGRVSMQKFE